MWGMRGVAEVVIETARSGIRPVQDAVDLGEALRFFVRGANLGKPVSEPSAIVQDGINEVQICSASDTDGLIAGNAQLHADALEQTFGEFENAGTQIAGARAE